MMSVKLCVRFLVVLALGTITAGDKCPPNENIAPCTCETKSNNAEVSCSALQKHEELREALIGLKGMKTSFLEVTESNIGDLPGDVFKDTHIEELSFKMAKFTSIGDDTNPPFSGLENSLIRLTIEEGFWNYDKPLTKPIKLGHLKKLTHCSLEKNVIYKLGNDWFENGPTSLKELYITTALTKEVGDKAFTPLKNIRSLHFSGNMVTLQRSALPENPLYLNSLDLSENEIVQLPSDMFKNLPALKYVYLTNNGIESIPESTWKTILPQLDFVFFDSNPLVCDSKIEWLLKRNLHEKILGRCALPKSLTGREIDSLTADDISG